jgi:hypothetical protein
MIQVILYYLFRGFIYIYIWICNFYVTNNTYAMFGILEIYEYQICLFNAIFRCLTEFLWISMDMFNYYMFFFYMI